MISVLISIPVTGRLLLANTHAVGKPMYPIPMMQTELNFKFKSSTDLQSDTELTMKAFYLKDSLLQRLSGW
jgi:hypothetical protein